MIFSYMIALKICCTFISWTYSCFLYMKNTSWTMETFLSPFCWSCWPLCLMQIEYQFPPGGRYTKASSPKGPMAWPWQEVGQGGS